MLNTMNLSEEKNTVLIVEDDQGLLYLIQKNLQRLGFRTDGTTSAAVAIEIIAENPPLLLLLDYQLDEMTGRQLIETLNQQYSTPPFIIMTGHGNETIAVEMMKLGARDYLIKDASFLELLPSVVKQAVNHLKMENKLEAAVLKTKRLEELLRQAQKMEAIGTMAGGIAHDFNNILTAILGYTEMAIEDSPSGSQIVYQLEQVLKAGHRAKDLIKHILAFSRKDEVNRISLNLQQIINETISLLKAILPSTVIIKKDIDPTCGNVLADPTQIHQVLINLCTNSSQSMEKSEGNLEIILQRVEIDHQSIINSVELRPGTFIKLSVRDNGPGIPSTIIDRIFDPYFTTKKVGQGSGMGLAVVHGIVKSHDGIITVQSDPGKETVFEVYFPEIATEVAPQATFFGDLQVGTERILLVDDEVLIADITGKRLERLGYQVVTETSSKIALELFLAAPDDFDLVITDQTMPHLSGAALAAELLKERLNIPIIMISGYSTNMSKEKAAEIGIKAFAMKPIAMHDLASIIRTVLDHK